MSFRRRYEDPIALGTIRSGCLAAIDLPQEHNGKWVVFILALV
jgi:hypothetical protein